MAWSRPVGSCLCRPGQVSGLCRGGLSGTSGDGSGDGSRPRCVLMPGAGRQAEISDREVPAGLVERVTFHNPAVATRLRYEEGCLDRH